MTSSAGAVTRRGWTHAEVEALRVLAPFGGPACALAFDRSVHSILQKAVRLGVSLRRKSCGTQMAQCGPAVLRKVTEFSQANLCPACAKWPIDKNFADIEGTL